MEETHNLRVERIEPLVAPAELRATLPLSDRSAQFIAQTRRAIEAILEGRDGRRLAIVGPCSIHDPKAALEYARRLAPLRERLADRLLICMRVYFEKPRTTVGWKGLINDPHMDGRCDVATGLLRARALLLQLADMGMPTATETLDPVSPQYLSDLISWTAIGARTTESQTHREMASGLSMPVGFKNGTDGGLTVALNAMQASRASHSFIGIDEAGQVGVVRTAGNHATHVVLRGGSGGPNYCETDVRAAAERLGAAGLRPRVRIGTGRRFLWLGALYAVLRMGLEVWRGDAVRGLWFGGTLSTSQLLSGGLLILVVFLWRRADHSGGGATGGPRPPSCSIKNESVSNTSGGVARSVGAVPARNTSCSGSSMPS